MSTPVIKAVRDAYPNSYIAFMVQPYSADVVSGNPYLNEVIVYDKDGEHKSLLKTIQFAIGLRNRGFDLALLLHPTNRTHMIAFLAGIPERIGYDRKLGFLLTKMIPHTKQFGLKHERDYALDIVRYIGIEPADKSLYMPINELSERRVKQLLAERGIASGEKVVVLHPGASCPSKRWKPERFALVADKLADKYGVKIVIISSSQDKAFGDAVASLMRKPYANLSGQTSVADLASVLKRGQLFISNDSGPVHIACAVGTPVISIFGRNDRGLSPLRWGPTGSRDIILHKEVGCEICLAHNCRIGFKCLEAITVEDVVSAAGRILGKT